MNRLLLISSCVVSWSALAASPVGLTAEEFKMVQHYKLALEDPRVQKMKPEARLGAIARDAKFKPKDLQAALDKAEAEGDVKAKCESNIKEALSKSELAGRTGKVELDTSAAHAVAYIQWANAELEKLPVEAAWAAALTQEACPLVSTIQVWALDKADPKKRVFQALISGAAAGRIKQADIKDFAVTRYIRLFEKVKSAANGDDLSEASAAASSGGP
ncbi:MAG: hypothetical protein K1X64_00480 [Myxococcaceae bacterium]|nr:hypothetical protein [Myxococcaceae bacterium]